VMMVFVALCEVLAPSLLPLLVPGFPPDTMAHAVRLTRIVLPGQLAFLAAGVVAATIYSRESFWAPALAPLFYNLGILAGGLLWGPGIDGFAWGVLLGSFGGVLGLPFIAARKTLRWSPRVDLRDRDFLDFMKLSLPLMLGFSLLTVDEWFGRWLGSKWTGTLTHLNNARRLMLVPTAVLGQATAMASLPFLTRLHAEGRTVERDRVLGVALAKVAAVTAVAGLGLAALAPAAVVLVFGRGAYGPEDVRVTASLLEVYALAVPAWGLQAVAVRAFYAARDTLTPMLLATVITVLMAPVYGVLAHAWGPVGIPAAGAVGMWVNAVVTLIALRRRGIRPDLAVAVSDGLKALGAATVVGAAVLWVRQAGGDWGRTPSGALVLGGGGGLLFGGLILFFLRRGPRVR